MSLTRVMVRATRRPCRAGWAPEAAGSSLVLLGRHGARDVMACDCQMKFGLSLCARARIVFLCDAEPPLWRDLHECGFPIGVAVGKREQPPRQLVISMRHIDFCIDYMGETVQIARERKRCNSASTTPGEELLNTMQS